MEIPLVTTQTIRLTAVSVPPPASGTPGVSPSGGNMRIDRSSVYVLNSHIPQVPGISDCQYSLLSGGNPPGTEDGGGKRGRKKARVDQPQGNMEAIFGGLSTNYVTMANRTDMIAKIYSSDAHKPNRDQDCCFTKLENAFGASNVGFNVDIGLDYGGASHSHNKKGILLQRRYSSLERHQAFPMLLFTFDITENPSGFWVEWRNLREPVIATVTVTAVISSKGLALFRKNTAQGPGLANKRMLAEGILMDAVLVSKNRVEVQCHKSLLAVHSSVFRRMFESQMLEGQTGTVNMEEVSELGVRALVHYLYCWELDKAADNCAVALELLYAANQYDITVLEEAMKDLIVTKDNKWFTIPLALELVQFALKKTENENNVRYQAIRDKALEVLKAKPIGDLRNCAEFKGLFRDENAGGMDLCLLLFSNK